jgi:hypothetical protein
VTDAAGQSGPDDDVDSPGVSVDRTAPTIFGLALGAAVVRAGARVRVQSSASDDLGVGSVAASIGPFAWQSLSVGPAGVDGVQAVAGTLVAPSRAGTYLVCLRAADLVGNVATGSSCAELIVAVVPS